MRPRPGTHPGAAGAYAPFTDFEEIDMDEMNSTRGSAPAVDAPCAAPAQRSAYAAPVVELLGTWQTVALDYSDPN